MSETGQDARRIDWVGSLPVLRLFSAGRRSIAFAPLVLGLLCVSSLYLLGRLLDAAWVASGRGVVVAHSAPIGTQIEAFSRLDGPRYAEWVPAQQPPLRAAPASQPSDWSEQKGRVRDLVERRAAKAIESINGDSRMSPPEKSETRHRVSRLADVLRFQLAEHDTSIFEPADLVRPAADLWQLDASIDTRTRVAELESTQRVLAQCQESIDRRLRQPRGPFITLLDHEMRSFAAAVDGAIAGRWGAAGSAYDAEPSMLGSIGSALRGVLWLLLERPWYAVLYGIGHLMAMMFFGVAISRYAAIQSAREEDASLGSLLGFACHRAGALVGAPLMPIGIFLGAGLVLWVMSVFGAIPGVGGVIWVLSSALYILALLGGVVMVFAAVITAFASHLYAPTIAAEGSDAYDAVSRSAAYVLQRPWHAGAYAGVLLLAGAATFVFVRLLAMLILKFTHAATSAGLSFGGNLSSFRTDTISRLDAIWHMPRWQDLPFLPTAGGPAFWGQFGIAPLSTTEWMSMGLISLWVFLVVAAVGAFVVSFYFCGAMEAYFLLRRTIDSADYHELYYEDDYDPRDGPPEVGQPPAAAAAAAGTGTSLPVIGPGGMAR